MLVTDGPACGVASGRCLPHCSRGAGDCRRLFPTRRRRSTGRIGRP